MSNGAEDSRIFRACNNQNSFLNSVNPLVRCIISQGVRKCRIVNVLLKNFKKHQSDFNYIKKTGKELLAII